MIWESVIGMTTIDVVILAIAAVTVYLFLRLGESIEYNTTFKLGSYSLLFGCALIVLFYLADPLTMHVLPLFMPRQAAMQIMTDLHLNYRWPVSLLSLIALSAGLIGVLRGTVIGQRLLLAEIAIRQQTESDLQISEQRFRMVFETISSGAVVIDANGFVKMCNPAAELIFGYKADQLEGRNVSMLMPELDRSRHDGYLKDYGRTGAAKIIGIGRQVTGLRKNGKEFPLQLEVSPTQFDGEACFIGLIADLTEITSLQNQLRQSQKLEAVGQLTGGVAHDFNNLLAVIQGNLSLLAEDLKTGTGGDPMELLQPALDASNRGADLTQRLLAFSRKQTLAPSIVAVNKLVASMEELLRRTLGETIDLAVSLRAGDWAVLIDQSQLESALLNLALNARDAMADGGRMTIETRAVQLDETYVSTRPGVTAGDYVLLSVSDTGTGMVAEILERVFEPFFTTKEIGRGSGLGLSVVHGFIKQSGGHIDIYSEPGQGATVKLYLPRSLAAKDEPASAPATRMAGHGELILVVEDDAIVRHMTLRMLGHLGYKTLEAADGKTALKQINKNSHISLLLSDVVLAGDISGPQIADAAQAIRPGMPVLMMSGYTETTIVRHGHVDGDALLVSKPFSIDKLAAKVHEALKSDGRT